MGRKNKSKRKESTASESHDETTPLGTTDTTPAAPAPSPCAERNTETPTAPVTTPTAETNTPSTSTETNTPSTAPDANPTPAVTSSIIAAATGTTTEANPPAAPLTEARPADAPDAPGLLRRIIRWIPIVGRYV
jgi:hypothetical protein